MKKRKLRSALTLIEIITVVAVITVLAGLVISLSGRIDTAGKENSAKALLATLDIALGQFRDFGYNYADPALGGLKFPLDCTDFNYSGTPSIESTLGMEFTMQGISGGTHQTDYSGSEILYFFLNRVPQSRETLGMINKDLITDKDENNDPLTIQVDNIIYQLFRIIDPWGRPLRYDYYDETNLSVPFKDTSRSFPVITSAGPDGQFNTEDDITNR